MMTIEEKVLDIPQRCRATYKKAMRGRSPASGIKAFCTECMGYSKADVKHCPSTICPLHRYRPYRAD